MGILDLSWNELDDAEEIEVLQSLPMLYSLFLENNPLVPSKVDEKQNYRLRTLHSLPKLAILDGIPISAEEKVSAINIHSPPAEVLAGIHHSGVVKKLIKQYAKIRAVDLMQASRLRPIVLCGPSGVGKRTLTNRLLKEFPHIFGLSVSHTTRKPRAGEENGTHYYFVSKAEMESLIEQGQFIETMKLFGQMYGISFKAIDQVTEQGKICILDLEFDVHLVLFKAYLQSHRVLYH